MPQVTPIYETLDEFKKIARQLIDKYPDVFYGTPVDSIQAVKITNKSRTERNKDFWKVRAVPLPISLDCPYSHYVIVHEEDWVGMDKPNQILLVASALCSVPKEEGDDAASSDAKVVSPDLRDWNVMVRTFGPDYLEKQVTDILDEDVEFVIKD